MTYYTHMHHMSKHSTFHTYIHLHTYVKAIAVLFSNYNNSHRTHLDCLQLKFRPMEQCWMRSDSQLHPQHAMWDENKWLLNKLQRNWIGTNTSRTSCGGSGQVKQQKAEVACRSIAIAQPYRCGPVCWADYWPLGRSLSLFKAFLVGLRLSHQSQ